MVKDCERTIFLGQQGENKARTIDFNRDWPEKYGEGTYQLLHQRNGDVQPYPVSLTRTGDTASWEVLSSDTAVAGYGRAELQYRVGDVVVKSEIFQTKVLPALGEAAEPPEPWEPWVETVLEAGSAAQTAAESATASAATATTAKTAAELAQTAAENAKTVAVSAKTVAESSAASAASAKTAAETAANNAAESAEAIEDLTVSASGLPAGSTPTVTKTGGDGEPYNLAFGIPAGEPGQDGADGHSPVVTATKVGTVTTVKVDGTAIATINDGAPGQDGADGSDGAPGTDGITPTIGANGNWYLGDTDTGKPSRGEQGEPGSDAEVTAENITAALGYVPADEEELDEKQDAIADLSTIRSGASAGATALQPSAIVSSVSAASTNAQVPGAKLFYDTVGNVETAINLIRGVSA